LIDPGTYTYYNTIWQAGFDPPVSRPGEYSTDIVAGTALEFIDEAYKAKDPFFIGIAPIAPHSQVQVIPGTLLAYFQPPVPAIRHQSLFPGVKIPREQNFNPDTVSDLLHFDQSIR
jgi:N-acetylglucosamine-6-sulfatase